MADENTNIQGENLDSLTDKSSYTAEEVQKLLQSEVDRRITSAQKKWEKESKLKLSEAEKLARMTEEQRHTAELESKIKELEERDKQLAIRENKITALQIMDAKGIPAYLVDDIVDVDADVMDAKIKRHERWKKELTAAISKELMKGSTPHAGSPINTKMTKADFDKLPLSKQREIRVSNPDLYFEITGIKAK